MVTKDKILESFRYDEDAGKLYHREARGSAKKGQEAGRVVGRGYRSIRVEGVPYYLHRLIWILHHDKVQHTIDHIDHDISNNHISNLRDVTPQENAKNCKLGKNNTSGVQNVWKRGTKWVVQIWVDGSNKYLGSYEDIELAKLVAIEARKKYNYHPNHGAK